MNTRLKAKQGDPALWNFLLDEIFAYFFALHIPIMAAFLVIADLLREDDSLAVTSCICTFFPISLVCRWR